MKKDKVHELQKRIEKLKKERKQMEEYLDLIDDRNSIKLEKIKRDMGKILKKDQKS